MFSVAHRVCDVPSPQNAGALAPAFEGGNRILALWGGMALAATGKPTEAQADYEDVAAAENNTLEDAVFAMPVNNKTK